MYIANGYHSFLYLSHSNTHCILFWIKKLKRNPLKRVNCVQPTQYFYVALKNYNYDLIYFHTLIAISSSSSLIMLLFCSWMNRWDQRDLISVWSFLTFKLFQISNFLWCALFVCIRKYFPFNYKLLSQHLVQRNGEMESSICYRFTFAFSYKFV